MSTCTGRVLGPVAIAHAARSAHPLLACVGSCYPGFLVCTRSLYLVGGEVFSELPDEESNVGDDAHRLPRPTVHELRDRRLVDIDAHERDGCRQTVAGGDAVQHRADDDAE